MLFSNQCNQYAYKLTLVTCFPNKSNQKIYHLFFFSIFKKWNSYTSNTQCFVFNRVFNLNVEREPHDDDVILPKTIRNKKILSRKPLNSCSNHIKKTINQLNVYFISLLFRPIHCYDFIFLCNISCKYSILMVHSLWNAGDLIEIEIWDHFNESNCLLFLISNLFSNTKWNQLIVNIIAVHLCV